MSTVAEVRAAIAAAARAVPGFGQVHEYERYVRDEAKFKQLYTFTPSNGPLQLRGWWLRRVRTVERSPHIGRVINVHDWRLRGYMSLADADASELEFDRLIESFRDAVRADPTFGGVCIPGDQVDGDAESGVQVEDLNPVLFCNVLCNSAVLSLKTWSYL